MQSDFLQGGDFMNENDDDEKTLDSW